MCMYVYLKGLRPEPPPCLGGPALRGTAQYFLQAYIYQRACGPSRHRALGGWHCGALRNIFCKRSVTCGIPAGGSAVVVVVEYYCFLIILVVEPPGAGPSAPVSTKRMFFSIPIVSSHKTLDRQIRISCCRNLLSPPNLAFRVRRP